MTFTLDEHKMKPKFMQYYLRSVPLVISINEFGYENYLSVEQKQTIFKKILLFEYVHMHCLKLSIFLQIK